MKEIVVKRKRIRDRGISHIVLVSDEDYEAVSRMPLSVSDEHCVMSKGKVLARVLMGEPHGMQVDHIDGNRLNNQRRNLRVVTAQQNACNRGKPGRCGDLPKGVRQMKSGRFRVRVKANGKEYYFGTYDTPEEAHMAYRRGAEIHHGQYARFR